MPNSENDQYRIDGIVRGIGLTQTNVAANWYRGDLDRSVVVVRGMERRANWFNRVDCSRGRRCGIGTRTATDYRHKKTSCLIFHCHLVSFFFLREKEKDSFVSSRRKKKSAIKRHNLNQTRSTTMNDLLFLPLKIFLIEIDFFVSERRVHNTETNTTQPARERKRARLELINSLFFIIKNKIVNRLLSLPLAGSVPF